MGPQFEWRSSIDTVTRTPDHPTLRLLRKILSRRGGGWFWFLAKTIDKKTKKWYTVGNRVRRIRAKRIFGSSALPPGRCRFRHGPRGCCSSVHWCSLRGHYGPQGLRSERWAQARPGRHRRIFCLAARAARHWRGGQNLTNRGVEWFSLTTRTKPPDTASQQN